MSEKHSPMEQFRIHNIFDINLGGLDLPFTNSSLAMTLSILVVFVVLGAGAFSAGVIPSKLQVLAEGFYNFVHKLVFDNVQDKKKAKKFFPLIFSVFLFVLFSNLMGMLPYSFTATSQLAVTLSLASVIFLTTLSIGLAKHGYKFLGVFIPHGTPLWLAPVMLVIELFSYLVRPLTLSVRLAANMVAGHTVLKVIAGFVAGMAVFGVIPIAFLSVLTGFEIFIACLQAYIFSLLSSIYINEALSH